MAKTRKVLDIQNGVRIVCIKNLETNRNPYAIKQMWYDGGWHSKTIVKYQDFCSVVSWLNDIRLNVKEWSA